MPTAILIDGGYFVKRFRRIEPHNANNAERAAEVAHRWALAHLTSSGCQRRELYRIFFYDCPPLQKRMHNPISGINYARSPRRSSESICTKPLKQKRKVALRLGQLADSSSWTTDSRTLDALLKGKRSFSTLLPEDLHPEVRQKGVDMRIGLDISSLSLKRQVRQIVLVAGDADFIPLPSSRDAKAWTLSWTRCGLRYPKAFWSISTVFAPPAPGLRTGRKGRQ